MAIDILTAANPEALGTFVKEVMKLADAHDALKNQSNDELMQRNVRYLQDTITASQKQIEDTLNILTKFKE